MKENKIEINGHLIGSGNPAYIVAELSANHNHRLNDAVALIRSAKEAGANAVKLQTYTPDTLTIASKSELFQIHGGLWDGRTLHDLYAQAYTPWEWHQKLKNVAEEVQIDLFSSPFDPTAVQFLEDLGMPAYKIASFEIVDLPLIRLIAKTGKPVIMSTGMASYQEIEEAVHTLQIEGNSQIVLLHCVSAYPAPDGEMNLRTIPDMVKSFGLPVGLSDHSLGIQAAVSSISLGACMIEKHFTLSRAEEGPDSAFSLEPHELSQLVTQVRTVEELLGEVHYGPTEHSEANSMFRRSLFVVADIHRGELFTEANVRSIRPGNGLAPKHLYRVLGKVAATEIKYGTPLSWDLINE